MRWGGTVTYYCPSTQPSQGDEECIFPNHTAPPPPVTAIALEASLSSPSGGAGKPELSNELVSLPKSMLTQDGKKKEGGNCIAYSLPFPAFPP